MPVEYARDDPRRRIRVTVTDPITLAELLAIVDRQVVEDTWTYGMLYDATFLSEPMAAKDAAPVLVHVRAHATVHGPRGPVAIVSRAGKVIGKSQAYADLGSRTGLAIEVFWDAAEAERWLDARLGF